MPANACWPVYTHPFNGPLSGTTQVIQYQKGKTNLDLNEARDSEWQWHQLGHMQVCTSLQADNRASTRPLSFLQARCPCCHPAKHNSVKALKAKSTEGSNSYLTFNGPLSGTTQVIRYQKGKTNQDFTVFWCNPVIGNIHCVSKKTRHQTLAHNFPKC